MFIIMNILYFSFFLINNSFLIIYQKKSIMFFAIRGTIQGYAPKSAFVTCKIITK